MREKCQLKYLLFEICVTKSKKKILKMCYIKSKFFFKFATTICNGKICEWIMYGRKNGDLKNLLSEICETKSKKQY